MSVLELTRGLLNMILKHTFHILVQNLVNKQDYSVEEILMKIQWSKEGDMYIFNFLNAKLINHIKCRAIRKTLRRYAIVDCFALL